MRYGLEGFDDIREKDVIEAFSLTAVSYTHLRAHETVLDLVCRLLLEKQKHRRPQQHYHLKQHTLK